jgi:serine/threonine protein kinase
MVWAAGHELHNGKYVIREVLGQGGFGITYKVWHVRLDAFSVGAAQRGVGGGGNLALHSADWGSVSQYPSGGASASRCPSREHYAVRGGRAMLIDFGIAKELVPST